MFQHRFLLPLYHIFEFNNLSTNEIKKTMYYKYKESIQILVIA